MTFKTRLKLDHNSNQSPRTIRRFRPKVQSKKSSLSTSFSRIKSAMYLFLYTWFVISNFPVQAAEYTFKPNWLAVSDPLELNRTWTSALVQLPENINAKRGKWLRNEEILNSMILEKLDGVKLPVILFLHACEGLGHHRDDIENYSKLGFAVIALDSFARDHRPLGCYEEQEQYIKYYDLAVAFRKAELDYAVERLKKLPWVDANNKFLIGSGIGGMVVAHYQGTEFSGHVIEGWGCRHPHKVFDGIWTPPNVRIYSVVSKNDRWYNKTSGFGIDCASFLRDRPDSVSVILDRPAHYVGWYPNSRPALIKFLTRDLDVDQDALLDDTPAVIETSEQGITLKVRWSVESVYSAAKKHCSQQGKTSHVIGNNPQGVYTFVCS